MAVTPAGGSRQAETPQERSDEEAWRLAPRKSTISFNTATNTKRTNVKSIFYICSFCVILCLKLNNPWGHIHELQ